MSIIGIGNALTDILVHIPDTRILDDLQLSPGGMYLIDKDNHHRMMDLLGDLPLTLASGGSAANTMNGLSKMGVPSAFIGQIGNDSTGEAYRDHQTRQGIRPLLHISPATPSGKCISMILPDGERTMVTYLGAALEMRGETITPELFTGNRIAYVEGYLLNSPHVIEPALESARREGLKIALDAASFTVIREYRDYALSLVEKYVDIIFANEDEAEALTGQSDPELALHELGRFCETTVVKVGAEGSWILQDGLKTRIGTIPANPVDKTGAGDLYAAGFLYGYTRGLDLKLCGDIAAVVSSKSIETVGAQLPERVWNEIHGMVREIENGKLSL